MAIKINNIKTYNTFIYGVINDLLGLNNSYVEQKTKGDDTYIPGGFVEKEISFFKPIPLEKREFSFNKMQLGAFSEIVSMIKGNDIELILVYAPITQLLYNSYTNNCSFDSLMKDYSEYYNFNKIMSLEDSLHFYDTHHLNQNGVELFNLKLIEMLKEK